MTDPTNFPPLPDFPDVAAFTAPAVRKMMRDYIAPTLEELRISRQSEREGWRYAHELSADRDRLATLATTAPAADVRDGWVSAANRLPEKNTEVMVFFEGVSSLASTGQYTGSVHDHDGWCYPRENFDDASGEWPKVTHWQPLPTPPQATGKAEGGV